MIKQWQKIWSGYVWLFWASVAINKLNFVDIFVRSRSFISDLWYWQHCNGIVELTDIKRGPFSKHLFQRTQQHGGCTKPLGSDKFQQDNNAFQLSYGIKNIHQSKMYRWYTDLGKTFLQLLLLKVCAMFSSDKVYVGLHGSSLQFSRREDQINTVYGK